MDHITEFTVAGHFLSYLINGDVSGMTDEEERQVYAFEAEAMGVIQNCHWSYESDEESFFARCEICDLMADCITLQLVNMDIVLASRAT